MIRLGSNNSLNYSVRRQKLVQSLGLHSSVSVKSAHFRLSLYPISPSITPSSEERSENIVVLYPDERERQAVDFAGIVARHALPVARGRVGRLPSPSLFLAPRIPCVRS